MLFIGVARREDLLEEGSGNTSRQHESGKANRDDRNNFVIMSRTWLDICMKCEEKARTTFELLRRRFDAVPSVVSHCIQSSGSSCASGATFEKVVHRYNQQTATTLWNRQTAIRRGIIMFVCGVHSEPVGGEQSESFQHLRRSLRLFSTHYGIQCNVKRKFSFIAVTL